MPLGRYATAMEFGWPGEALHPLPGAVIDEHEEHDGDVAHLMLCDMGNGSSTSAALASPYGDEAQLRAHEGSTRNTSEEHGHVHHRVTTSYTGAARALAPAAATGRRR